MKAKTQLAISGAALAAMLATAMVPVTAQAGGYYNGPLTIYFTRHAEKETVTEVVMSQLPPVYTIGDDGDPIPTDGIFDPQADSIKKAKVRNDVCGKKKCAEVLSKQGEARALLLADWFGRRGITKKLDAVYATHKTRTQQTVRPTATAAGLDVEQLPLLTDDNGVMVPANELMPESTTPSECATLEAIFAAKDAGMDTILVAGHSGTLYDIMGDGNEDCPEFRLGLDTDDANRFPKDENGKVRDFGDVWQVVIRPNGKVRFGYRKNLQPMKLQTNTFAN